MSRFKKFVNQMVVKLGFAQSECAFPKTIICEEYPDNDNFENDTIYILGEKNYLYSISFVCPCRSGHITHLSLHQDEHPFWKVDFHINGTVTLSPSIWYKQDCYSHFFIRNGQIIGV